MTADELAETLIALEDRGLIVPTDSDHYALTDRGRFELAAAQAHTFAT